MMLLNSFAIVFLTLLYCAFITLCVYLYVFLIKEICQIARDSKRNVAAWVILSILVSPFIATILITCFELCRAIKESREENKAKVRPLNESDHIDGAGFSTD